VKLGDIKDVALLAALLGAGYAAYRIAGKGKESLDAARLAVTDAVFEFFHPDAVGETLFYTVRFPDGATHAVPSRAVDRNGVFTNRNLSPQYAGDGKRYRILVDTSKPAGINKVAQPI
jgi:hypothetical protein